jgi:phosphoglucomutase
MSHRERYRKWLDSAVIDDMTRRELLSIDDEKELESRFASTLEFGTGGLRGLLGAGLNRINAYTVRHATQGLANLISRGGEAHGARGVAIAYDSRVGSAELAMQAALVLAANGIRSCLFDGVRPTPELSFAVRHLRCVAGINVTASHNPKEYNGYKAYWEDGSQLPPALAEAVHEEMARADIFDDVKMTDERTARGERLLQIIGDEVDEAYLRAVLSCRQDKEALSRIGDRFSVVYTPFHGAGHRLVPEALERSGLRHLHTVPRQMTLDGNFPTLKSPNPENREGFALAIALAKQKNADLILGTDPDSDRLGALCRVDGASPGGRPAEDGYLALSGNQIGVLLLDYVIQARKRRGDLPENAGVITSVVSTDMAERLCAANRVGLTRVFTGFRYVGEKMRQWESTGEREFIFGFEESLGYLAGTHCRDKDAVCAAMLLAEAAAHYKSEGLSLWDALEALYEKYGHYDEKTVSLDMPGRDGLKKTRVSMERLRKSPPTEIAGAPVHAFLDYRAGERLDLRTNARAATELSGSNLLCCVMSDGSRIAIRPSGTEPKIKLYILVNGRSHTDTANKISAYETAAKRIFETPDA